MSTPTQRSFAGDPTAPAAARLFAQSALAALAIPAIPESVSDDVQLVVSELVTNAVRAQSPNLEVSIALEGDRIVVRVSDEATGWPEARDAGIHETSGRGLPLVSAVSTSWGVRMSPTGKVVWAELTIPAG